MKNYGKTKSNVMPKTMELTESKVFVSTDIRQITEILDETENQVYEFNLVEYDKDEYIQMISEKNDSLEKQVTDTQIALCEVYEMML